MNLNRALAVFTVGVWFASGGFFALRGHADDEKGKAQQEVIALDLQKAIAARADAERSRDIDTLSRMTTDDFTLTNQRGEIITKAARIEQLKTGPINPDQLPTSDEKIRMYVDTALRTRRIIRDGQPIRMLTVWVRQDGQWKVAATQITPEQNTPRTTAESTVSAEEEILWVEEQRRQAILHNDAAAMDRLLAEEFIRTDYEGQTHDRADELSLYKDNRRQTRSWQASDVKVRVYSDAAVVTERAAVKDVLDGQPRDAEYGFTHVWAKRDGRWQLVARHGSHIPQTAQSASTQANAVSSPANDSATGPDAQAVLARTDELNQAFLHADMAVLERIVADDCIQITQNGTQTKAEWLAPYRNGARRLESIAPPEWRRIRLYGDVAVVTSAGEIVVLVQGERRTYRLFSTRTWVKRSGQWYLVMTQNTPRAELESRTR